MSCMSVCIKTERNFSTGVRNLTTPENYTNRIIKAQSDLADLQNDLHRFLLSREVKPLGMVHNLTCYEYKGFKFELTINLLAVNKEK